MVKFTSRIVQVIEPVYVIGDRRLETIFKKYFEEGASYKDS